MELAVECSQTLIQILDQEEMKLNKNTKILIVQQATKLLSISLSANSEQGMLEIIFMQLFDALKKGAKLCFSC